MAPGWDQGKYLPTPSLSPCFSGSLLLPLDRKCRALSQAPLSFPQETGPLSRSPNNRWALPPRHLIVYAAFNHCTKMTLFPSL